jgi:hypothetical protein
MPSTYSTNLKIELISTGEQSGTWGTTTNTNLGTLLEEAICGVGAVTMLDADTTITISNGASSTARKVILTVTGTLTANRNLIVPSINKTYIVYNNTTGGYAVTVKTSAGTGISVPNGQKRMVYGDSTNINEAVNSVGSFWVNGTLTSTGAGTFTGALTSNNYVYSNTGTAAMARFVLQNTNRTWSISNYGTSYSPNGRFTIADETAGTTWFSIDVGGLTSINGALNYGGVTLANAVTGTGNMVLSASPTLTGTVNLTTARGSYFISPADATTDVVTYGFNNSNGPTLVAWGSGSGGAGQFQIYTGGNSRMVISSTGTTTFTGALNYGGVTLNNSVTGTGSMVLSNTPTITSYADIAGIRYGAYTTGASFGGDGSNIAIRPYASGSTYFQSSSGSTWAFISSTVFNCSVPLAYGGVTLSNSVTGTGSMVLSNAPTFTGTVNIPTLNVTSSISWAGSTWMLQTSGYSVFYDGSARQNLFLGGTGDPTNYYRNSTHFFQTVGGSANILSMTGSLATFSVPINYGGVTLSNAVTGTGSMVLSNAPTFTGTVSGSTYNFTTADTAVGGRISGASGKIRLWGYFSGASTIDAAVPGESTYGPLRLTGNSLYLNGNGVDVVTVTSSRVTTSVQARFGSADMDVPSGSAPLAMARAWANWTGGTTTINTSMNVSSITRISAGVYYANFTTSAPHATYATVVSGQGGPGIFTGSQPDDATKALVISANTLSQSYQDVSVYSFVAYW